MSIFFTGGSGFIGRNLLPALLDKGSSVIALQNQHRISPSRHERLQIIDGSLSEISTTVRGCLDACDTILHLAGSTTPGSSAEAPVLDVRKSLLPTLNLLETAKAASIKRFIFASSGGTVYGRPRSTPIDEDHPTHPTSHYGVGKLAAEHAIRVWAESHGIEYFILRISNPYGPHQHQRGGQGVIGAWVRNSLLGMPLSVWGDGTVVRDYLYIEDLVAAVVAVCTTPRLPSGIYNVGSGRGNSLLQIADAVSRASGQEQRLHFEPSRPYDVPINILCNRRLQTIIDWRPTVSLEDGIQRTFRWMQHHTPKTASIKPSQ